MVNKYSLLLLASFSFLLSACSKDKEEEIEETHYNDYFTAVITPYGSSDKTYVESGEGNDYSCWADGDAVNINGTVRTVDVTGSADNYTAAIGADGIEAVNGGFIAAYPGDAVTVVNGTATFTLPATTEYSTVGSGAGAGTQVVDAPMVAYTTARDLQFENVGLLTLFNLNIAGSGQVTLQRITVSSDQPLSGSYSMTRQGDSWQRNATGLDGTSRALVCSDPIALNTTAQPFYLYLPPIAGATTFTVDVMLNVNGVRRHFAQTKTGTLSLAAGKCYDFGTLTYNVASETLTDNNSNSYDEVEPAGTEDDPYRISNATEWYYWCNKYATTSGKHFLLEEDISVSSAIPEFKGTLDGNGYSAILYDCSLINRLNSGTVKNITTEGSITSENFTSTGTRKCCGALAAYGTNITLRNCTNKANINHTLSYATFDLGGIVGYVRNENDGNSEIFGCRNEGVVNSTNCTSPNIGGIAGNTSTNSTHFINCSNTGNIKNTNSGSTDAYIGGLVGKSVGANNVIENSYSIGEIEGAGSSDKKGGITADNRSNCIIQNCYSFSSSLTLNLCQINKGTIQYCYHFGTNTFTTNTGEVYYCSRLDNATTIYPSINLATQLNTNTGSGFLNISNAWDWTVSNGYTVFVQ